MTPEKIVNNRITEIKKILSKEDRDYLEAHINSEIKKEKDNTEFFNLFFSKAGTYLGPILIIGAVLFIVIMLSSLFNYDKEKLKNEAVCESEKTELVSQFKKDNTELIVENQSLTEEIEFLEERVLKIEELCVNKIISE